MATNGGSRSLGSLTGIQLNKSICIMFHKYEMHDEIVYGCSIFVSYMFRIAINVLLWTICGFELLCILFHGMRKPPCTHLHTFRCMSSIQVEPQSLEIINILHTQKNMWISYNLCSARKPGF